MGKQTKRNGRSLFGKRLRALREEGGFTQDQIEEIAGMEQSAVSRIESGEQNIDLNDISVIAEFFGLEDYQLFQYNESIPEGDVLEKSAIRFLKRNGKDPNTFIIKGLKYYLNNKVLKSKFLNSPKFSKEIALYLKQNFSVEFSTSKISQAMNGLSEKGLIEKIATDKKSKFQYRKK